MNNDIYDQLVAVNASGPFNTWAGFKVLKAEPGYVEIQLNWKPELSQYSGFLHAGLIGALIDTVCGFAAYTKAGWVMASHYSVNCLSPAVGHSFVAHGHVIRAGKRQIFTRGELFAESDGGALKLVATGGAILVPTEPVGPA